MKEREVHLLLFGSPTSDKNILLKQLKIIYQKAETSIEEDEMRVRNSIRHLVLDQMHNLVLALNQFDLKLHNRKISQEFKSRDFVNTHLSFSRETADKVKLLWSDPSIRRAYLQTASSQAGDEAFGNAPFLQENRQVCW